VSGLFGSDEYCAWAFGANAVAAVSRAPATMGRLLRYLIVLACSAAALRR
jgi:hypothetical protein